MIFRKVCTLEGLHVPFKILVSFIQILIPVRYKENFSDLQSVEVHFFLLRTNLIRTTRLKIPEK